MSDTCPFKTCMTVSSPHLTLFTYTLILHLVWSASCLRGGVHVQLAQSESTQGTSISEAGQDPGLRAQLGLARPRAADRVLDTKSVGGPGEVIEVFAYSTDHTRLASQVESIQWSHNKFNTFNYTVLGVHGSAFKKWVSKVKLLQEPLK